MNHLDLKTLFLGFILGAGAILALGAASETERVGRYQVLTTSAGDVCQVITLDTVSGKAEVRGVHFQNKEPYVSGMKTFSFSK